MRSHLPSLLAAGAWLAVASVSTPTAALGPPATQIALPALFGDHMVLQRDRPVLVWGTAAPGGALRVELAGRERQAHADASGHWQVELPALPAGGPYQLEVHGGETLVFRDVLVGEVWLASGQSNMEMPIDGWAKVTNAEAETAAADHPRLRLLRVEHAVAHAPRADLTTAGWQVCTPQSVRAFSAAAYFFGRELERRLGVPVGLVQSTWGGTPIEAWTSRGSLARVDDFRDRLAQLAAQEASGDPAAQRETYRRDFAAWIAALPQHDRGGAAAPPWSARELETREWKSMALPHAWENAGLPDLDGVVWFRRTVEVPAAWAGQSLTLRLGPIDDADVTWFDGVVVGSEGKHDLPRVYRIPVELVTPGRHTIAIRVLDWIGGGGLWGEPAALQLALDEQHSIPLAGDWAYRIGLDVRELPPRPLDPDDPGRPTVLFNGMIAPLVPFGFRGAIWYQGEANAARAEQYRRLFPLLIEDWRRLWGQRHFPFLFVQLANWRAVEPQPGESDWAELREAQAMALALPDTAMATAIDLGEADDIHPRNKQEVGRRLALAAFRTAYRLPVVASGPTLSTTAIDGDAVRLHFTHAEGGLAARGGGELRGFALAGDDRVFHWAEARIDGASVVVRSARVPRPVAVRYAWATNPDANLGNGAGLPAPPFRTDRWPGITTGKK